jgi:hypothetical protein
MEVKMLSQVTTRLFEDLEKIYGSRESLAEAFEVTPECVRLWGRSRGIPAKNMFKVIRLAEQHGIDVTPEQLRPDLFATI